MATSWFWIVQTSEASAATRPSDAVLVSAASGSALYNQIQSQNAFTYNGKSYQVFQGPYASEAAAKAAPGAASSAAVVGAGVGAGAAASTDPGSSGAVTEGASIGSTVANAATSWESAIGNFAGTLTQANLWIRVAKIVVGGVLVMIGISHITGLEGAAADLARKVPVPV